MKIKLIGSMKQPRLRTNHEAKFKYADDNEYNIFLNRSLKEISNICKCTIKDLYKKHPKLFEEKNMSNYRIRESRGFFFVEKEVLFESGFWIFKKNIKQWELVDDRGFVPPRQLPGVVGPYMKIQWSRFYSLEQAKEALERFKEFDRKGTVYHK